MSTHSGKSGGRSRAGGAKTPVESIASLHERSARLQVEQGLPREVRPEELTSEGIRSAEEIVRAGLRLPTFEKMYADTAALQWGEERAGAVIASTPRRMLVAEAKRLGVPAGGTNAEIASRLTAHVTQGRYSANFGKPEGTQRSGDAYARRLQSLDDRVAKLERQLNEARQAREAHVASRGQGGAAQQQQATPAPARATGARIPQPQSLTPIGPVDLSRLPPVGTSNPFAFHTAFGATQMRQALSGYPIDELRNMARIIQRAYPDTAPQSWSRKAHVLDYIMQHAGHEPGT